jgi:putative flavoprotein involved in K+ transport
MAGKLSPEVYQVHTGVYRNPSELPEGTVVVVGAANSGAQIAPEIAATHRTLLSQGSPLPHFPRKFLFKGLHWWGDKFGLIAKPLIGERDRLHKKTIIVGPGLKTISRRHNVELVPRTMDADGRTLRFEGGREVDVDAVVWATGFRYDYSWIDVPVFGDGGLPVHDRGVTAAAGLYFLGMQCQYSYGSGLIYWVKDDAEYLVQHLAARRGAPAASGAAVAPAQS